MVDMGMAFRYTCYLRGYSIAWTGRLQVPAGVIEMKRTLVDAPEDPDDFFVRVLPRDGGEVTSAVRPGSRGLVPGDFCGGRGEAQSLAL